MSKLIAIVWLIIVAIILLVVTTMLAYNNEPLRWALALVVFCVMTAWSVVKVLPPPRGYY
jgi:hypothetical protein